MRSFTSITQYDHKQLRNAKRVINTLANEAVRLAKHFNGQRTHKRKPFQGKVSIRISNPDYATHGIGEPFYEFFAFCCDVSGSGLSFIYPEEIDHKDIVVGLEIGESQIWFQGEIVRRRELEQEKFWEFGVVFRDRIEL